MKRNTVLLFVLFSAIVCCASAVLLQQRDPNQHTFKVSFADDWSIVKTARNREHTLIFAPKLRNLDKLDIIFHEVSNPKHPNYGKYLTFDEAVGLISNPEGTAAIVNWLKTQGVEKIVVTPTGDFIHATMDVEKAGQMLNTQFYHFHHPVSNTFGVRALQYTIPEEVREHVDFIANTIQFPTTRPNAFVDVVPHLNISAIHTMDFPSGYTVPDVIFRTYGITNPSVASSKATQCLYENLNQNYNPSDLVQFQKYFNLPQTPVAQVIGPNDGSVCSFNPDDCGEATLDVQYMMAVAQNAPTTFWSIPNSDQSPFLDWITAVSNDRNPPLVHSISYGEIEEYGDSSTLSRFNTIAQRLGTQGVTVVVASGDDGVANFLARSNGNYCGFHPSFPASAPYVTAVGATMGPESGRSEIACTSTAGGIITTGGGFSTAFSQPSYQSQAVQQYLTTANIPPVSMFQENGRGYPDVSALGYNYVIINGGQTAVVSGTSASAPVFGAMLSLINGLRLKAGKSAVGFVNPALYQAYQHDPSIFIDITSGMNNCCAGSPGSQVCCSYGFSASHGWDPLTGLGSVHFSKFASYMTSL